MQMQDMKNYKGSNATNLSNSTSRYVLAAIIVGGVFGSYIKDEIKNGPTVTFTGKEQTASAKEKATDGTVFRGDVTASYNMPSTYTMEDYNRHNHFFSTSIGAAFYEVVGKQSARDVNANFASVAQQFCNAAANDMPTIDMSGLREQPGVSLKAERVACTLWNDKSGQSITVYAR